ncbi:phage/plasmid primase, P4 family [Pelagibius sp. CAU 1746]|uniref:phage/plasmid primase, P4 family n=1 Tax=Pelagibius sp. CAU 1746 TaxID=3140370 RepID=UPI00325B39E4
MAPILYHEEKVRETSSLVPTYTPAYSQPADYVQTPKTALEWAKHYRSMGYRPIPIPYKDKAPRLKGWGELALDGKELEAAFRAEQMNIGINLGEASGGLVDIDLDCEEAIRLAPAFLPPTEAIFGRSSKPKSHWLYRVTDCGDRTAFSGPDGAGMLLEYRANGSQTVFPGSVHPSGERVEFDCKGDPAHVSRDDLLSAVRKCAAASLIAKYWAKGSRHDLALALSGTLLKGGWSSENAVQFVEAVCHAAEDEDVEDRKRCIADTVARLARGEPVAGPSRLAELIGDRSCSCVQDWLGLKVSVISASRVSHSVMNSDSGELPVSDSHNGLLFAQKCSSRARYCYEHGCWYLWMGKQWKQDTTDQVILVGQQLVWDYGGYLRNQVLPENQQQVSRWMTQTLDQRKLRSMLELAKPHLAVGADELDSDPWLLNCENGTLDLKTGALRPHSPADLITKIVPVSYDPKAECPKWNNFLDGVCGGDQELVSYLQRVIGYTLTGSTSEQCMFLLHGTGANGKTTFLNAIKDILDPYARQAQAESLMVRRSEGARSDIARLAGARLVVTSESEANHKFAEGLVKQMTGGDPITARYLYQQEFEFVPQFKIFLATNRKPNIEGTDEGIWRRIHLIPFDVTFPLEKRDKGLPEKLRAEQQGILAWAVKGCLAWQNDGLQPPEKVRAATKEYRAESDQVAKFIDDCCELAPERFSPSKELYAAYEDWCVETVETPLPKSEFAKRLGGRGLQQGRTKSERRWYGIRLKDQTEA